MPDAVTFFIVTVFNSYSITEMASRLDFLFLKSKTQDTPPSWVFFCDEKMSSQLQFSQFKRTLAKSDL